MTRGKVTDNLKRILINDDSKNKEILDYHIRKDTIGIIKVDGHYYRVGSLSAAEDLYQKQKNEKNQGEFKLGSTEYSRLPQK